MALPRSSFHPVRVRRGVSSSFHPVGSGEELVPVCKQKKNLYTSTFHFIIVIQVYGTVAYIRLEGHNLKISFASLSRILVQWRRRVGGGARSQPLRSRRHNLNMYWDQWFPLQRRYLVSAPFQFTFLPSRWLNQSFFNEGLRGEGGVPLPW